MAESVASNRQGDPVQRRGRHDRAGRRTALGFTLVELMIAVAIVSILAAISLPMLSTYVGRSRTTEATGFLQEIKARQESYRFDFGMYCDVSVAQTAYYPNSAPGRRAQSWATGDAVLLGRWNLLGASPPGKQSLFSYSTVAGPPGTTPQNAGFSSTRNYNGLDFWFVSTAIADLDGDGTQMTYESYSHSKALYSSHGDNVE